MSHLPQKTHKRVWFEFRLSAPRRGPWGGNSNSGTWGLGECLTQIPLICFGADGGGIQRTRLGEFLGERVWFKFRSSTSGRGSEGIWILGLGDFWGRVWFKFRFSVSGLGPGGFKFWDLGILGGAIDSNSAFVLRGGAGGIRSPGLWGFWGGLSTSDFLHRFEPRLQNFIFPPSGRRLCFVHHEVKCVSSDVSKARAFLHFKF